jgi:hypothetical protein
VADGTEVKLIEETGYPFDHNIKFTIKTPKQVIFPLHLRIPSWCDRASIKINGELWSDPNGNQIVEINRKWKDKDMVELVLPMKVTTSRWFNNSVAVERGPLVYALRIEEEWKNVKGTDRYGDYREVRPTTPWNYGISEALLKDPATSFEVNVKNKITDAPWNIANAPIELRAKGKRIPEWQLYNETAGPLPYSTIRYLKERPEEIITLIPYGCSTLRISQFPVVQ